MVLTLRSPSASRPAGRRWFRFGDSFFDWLQLRYIGLFSSGIMISSISGVFGTLGCVAITAGGVGSAGVSTAGSFCGHTAAHKARQAANAVAVMICFFTFPSPFGTWKERPISSLYSERLSALFHVDSVPWRVAMPAQIQR